MKTLFNRSALQPLIGILASLFALLALAWAWNGIDSISLEPLTLALLLILAGILADQFPIHIRQNTKASISTVPLYLMAVLLPPHLAALSAGGSVLTSELMSRAKRDSSFSTIALAGGRWTIVGLLSALVAHAPVTSGLLQAWLLPAAALVMFLGDIVSVSFEIAPLSGEPLWHVIATTAGEANLLEGAQYLLGIFGALIALQEIWALGLLVLPVIVVYLAFKRLKEMQDGTRKLLVSMADKVDMRDPYTGGHSRRVADLCAGILRELPIVGLEAEIIVSAARVHDIGKIGIPDDILEKKGRLMPEEKAVMDSHADCGAELLARYRDFARGAEMVRHHHEHWDGKGYPCQLQGYDIPLGARVIAVADSYDAMTSDRPYRRAMTAAQAVQILRADRGRQWEPLIVETFLRSIAGRSQHPLTSPQVLPLDARVVGNLQPSSMSQSAENAVEPINQQAASPA